LLRFAIDILMLLPPRAAAADFRRAPCLLPLMPPLRHDADAYAAARQMMPLAALILP